MKRLLIALAFIAVDARMQAEKLAAVTGSTLGRATMITTGEIANSYGFMRNNVAADAITTTADGPAIESGTNVVTYT